MLPDYHVQGQGSRAKLTLCFIHPLSPCHRSHPRARGSRHIGRTTVRPYGSFSPTSWDAGLGDGGYPIGRTAVRPYIRSLTLAARLVGKGGGTPTRFPFSHVVGRGAKGWGSKTTRTQFAISSNIQLKNLARYGKLKLLSIHTTEQSREQRSGKEIKR
jgi:hypothetical protein